MSEWIDVVVYAALIVVVWGWLPARSSRLAIPVIADRNPEWTADHPEIARRIARSGWFRWSCLLWATISLLTLLAFQVGVWPRPLAFLRVTPEWEALKDLNSALFIAGLMYGAGCVVLFYRWLDANVPLASRRQATFERRSVHDHVPRAVQRAVYAIILLHLVTWAAVGLTGRYAAPAFWGGMAFQFVISGVFLLLVLSAVRRRPGAMHRIVGPGYRRTEVRVAFVAQLLPILNGAARLYEQTAGTRLENVDRVLHLGLVLVVVALAVWSRNTWSARGLRSTVWAGARSRLSHS